MMTVTRRAALRFIAGAALAQAVSACSLGRAGNRRGVVLAGSTSVQPFAERWAEEYRGGSVTVQSGGSTAGIKAAHDGTADIGMSSRPLHPDEKIGLVEAVVAYDAVAVIVNAASPVTAIQRHLLHDVFAGRVNSWRALGGPDRPITVITREEGSGTREMFENTVMMGARIRADALVTAFQGGLRKMVSEDRDAIGYLSLSRVAEGVRALALDGVIPSERTVANATYPLRRPFLFLTRGAPAGATRDFMQFVLSPGGQAVARAEGLVPVLLR